MTARALGGDVGARDFNSEIGIHHRYARITGGLSDDDALATRHEHAQVGVRLEAGTGAADLDPMSFPVGALAGALITPCAIVADIDCRAVRAAALWVDDTIRGIDHTKRLPPADISLFDAKLIGITAAARDLDLDVGSTSRFD